MRLKFLPNIGGLCGFFNQVNRGIYNMFCEKGTLYVFVCLGVRTK